MALAEDQKIRARELKAMGMSYRDIAEAIGSNKDAVSRYLKTLDAPPEKCDNPPEKNSPARTRTTKRSVAKTVAKSVATECDSATKSATDPDRQLMASMAFEDVQTMRDVALKGLSRVSSIEDIKERTWMESVYSKMLEKSTRMLGTWGGLDEMAEGENPALAGYADALNEVERTAVDEWEAKG